MISFHNRQKFVAGYYSPMAIGTIPPRQTGILA